MSTKYTDSKPKKGAKDDLMESITQMITDDMSEKEQFDSLPPEVKQSYKTYALAMHQQQGSVRATPLEFMKIHGAMKHLYEQHARQASPPAGFAPAQGGLGAGSEAGGLGAGLQALPRMGRYGQR